ncbi:hypothetical protein caldi_29960 [Caldinitratiruptor microaerophilus]|uniref:Uncharacterized protein n=1 Tax=Caldinitratiruptor microaerophilus TaxID=671077 RepID=A0AA35G6V1_9FIRM|nr:hypothetical protein caldi_29960 [Caldinitratiruptor microaerophilus]
MKTTAFKTGMLMFLIGASALDSPGAAGWYAFGLGLAGVILMVWAYRRETRCFRAHVETKRMIRAVSHETLYGDAREGGGTG